MKKSMFFRVGLMVLMISICLCLASCSETKKGYAAEDGYTEVVFMIQHKEALMYENIFNDFWKLATIKIEMNYDEVQAEAISDLYVDFANFWKLTKEQMIETARSIPFVASIMPDNNDTFFVKLNELELHGVPTITVTHPSCKITPIKNTGFSLSDCKDSFEFKDGICVKIIDEVGNSISKTMIFASSTNKRETVTMKYYNSLNELLCQNKLSVLAEDEEIVPPSSIRFYGASKTVLYSSPKIKEIKTGEYIEGGEYKEIIVVYQNTEQIQK